MCTKKTKTELIEEINNLKKDLDKLERYRKYEDTANEMKAIHVAYEIGGIKMADLVSKLYDELAKVKENRDA